MTSFAALSSRLRCSLRLGSKKQRRHYTIDPLDQVLSRVRFLINDVSDLDSAAKHARLAANNRMNPEISIRTCNTIIGAMCDAGRSCDALDLFDFFFNKTKMKPNIDSCNHIIKSHCEQGRFLDALLFYSHLCSSDNTPRPDNKTYDILIKALVDAGMMDQAIELFTKGRTQLIHSLKPELYMNLIRGFLEQGNVEMAYQLHDDYKYQVQGNYKTLVIRNDIAIFDSVFVDYFFKQGKDEVAMKLYTSSMIEDGFTPMETVGNAYLKVFLKNDKKTHAWALFQYMLDNYICYNTGFNADTVDIMVNECFEVGRFTDAVRIFTDTKAKTGFLPIKSYRNLITRLCQNGRLSEAESVFHEFLKEKITRSEPGPDFATYKVMLHAYIESGRTQDAVKIANKMIADHLKKVTLLFL